MKDLNFLVPPELGARGRIGIDLARFETCVYTVAPIGGEGNQKINLAPLLPAWEKGLGDEGAIFALRKVNYSFNLFCLFLRYLRPSHSPPSTAKPALGSKSKGIGAKLALNTVSTSSLSPSGSLPDVAKPLV